MYLNTKYEKPKHSDEEFANRVYKILDRLPLFVERTVGDILLGYSKDETWKGLAEVAAIYREFNVRMMFHGFFSMVDVPDFENYTSLLFSIATVVRIFLFEVFYLLIAFWTKNIGEEAD